MAAIVNAKMKGDKELVAAINRMPKIFIASLANWLKDERANFLGGTQKDSKGKTRRGYRDLLEKKPLAGGRTGRNAGGWSRQMSHLFWGKIPFAKRVNDLKLSIGVGPRRGGRKHQLMKALELLATGGAITSRRMMMVPIMRNIKRKGFDDTPMHEGSINTGMKSEIFNRINRRIKLETVKTNKGFLYFDPSEKKVRGAGYKKAGLLFVGVRGVRVRRMLKGRYDFYNRFDRMQGAMIRRGQRKVDRAIKIVERITK